MAATYDDFEIVRAIVNFSRNYPNLRAKRLKALVTEHFPGIDDDQIARCAKQILDSWE